MQNVIKIMNSMIHERSLGVCMLWPRPCMKYSMPWIIHM